MVHRFSFVSCVSIVLLACGATDSEQNEETVATAESLRILHEPVSSQISPAVRGTIIRAGLRLRALQADRLGDSAHNGAADADPDDGGWDWVVAPDSDSHSSSPSSENLYGATGLGLWAALHSGAGRPLFRTALIDAYLGVRQRSEVDSAPDFVLLALLSQRYSDPRYVELARERYDARVVAAGDASLLAANIRDTRHAAGSDGLIAYDIGWFALGALALSQAYPGSGYRADFVRYVTTVIDDLKAGIPLFDYRDTHEAYYVTGLAWSMLVSSWSPRASTLFDDLHSRLLELQLSNGAWPYSADYSAPNPQSTAHALIALGLTRRGRGAPHDANQHAVEWLSAQQGNNGGWAYNPDQEYPLIDAEIALGMYLVGSANTEHASTDGAKTAIALSAVAVPPTVLRAPLPTPAAPDEIH